MSAPIDVESTTSPEKPHEQGQALIKAEPRQPEPIKPGITPAQAKVEAIAELTMSAYAKAATLKLTSEEIERLQAEFPDEAFKPGAAGKEHLIYIEHAYLRDRLNQVFGPGQWAIIPRNRWAEPFKTEKGKDASRVYVEAMLLVRGCFVGEAVGEMEYYPHNASQNYGDAVEGAKTAALRRCCKELGIGLQAWKKDWCDGWWARKRGGRDFSRPQPATAPVKPAPPPAPTARKEATDKTREWMLKAILTNEADREIIMEFFRKIPHGALLPNEPLEQIPLIAVPTSSAELRDLGKAIADFANGADAKLPYAIGSGSMSSAPPTAPPKKPIEVPRDANPDPNSPDAPWRFFPVPFGKHAGAQLANLDTKVIFGYWANFEPQETWTDKEGKVHKTKPENLERDRLFRAMLNEAGLHYEFRKPEDKATEDGESDVAF